MNYNYGTNNHVIVQYSVKGLKQIRDWNELNDCFKLNQDENKVSLETRRIFFSSLIFLKSNGESQTPTQLTSILYRVDSPQEGHCKIMYFSF